MRRLFLLLASFLAVTALSAEEISFEVNVPRVVAVGEAFSVEFSINAQPKEFNPPSFDGFDVVAGPTQGKNSSVQFINGSMTKSVNYTYGYVLICPSEGEYTLGAADVKVDGKVYRTMPVTVKAIVEQGSQQQGADSAGRRNGAAQSGKAMLAKDDIMIVATANRTNVYKGQPVKVVYKLYTRVAMGSEGQKMPSFNGFWAQTLNVDQSKWRKETLDGKIYDACPIAEYLLFPQQSGKLTIEPMELSVVARIPVQGQRGNDIFDEFFGGPQIREIRRNISSQPITVSVRDLPAGAPKSFAGAVGEFEMKATPPSEPITANSAVTYTVRISGTGNLSMIQAPQIQLPNSFEQYNVKTTESIQTQSDGASGYRQFEYPMIARADGDFLISPVEFTYFSPKLAKYVTLSSQEVSLRVSPDTSSNGTGPAPALVSGIAKEDIKFLGRDIRFIQLGRPDLRRTGKLFMFSGPYFLAVLFIFGLFAFMLSWLGKRLKEMRNTAIVKGKRANKMALQRLRAAERHMNDENQKGFYEEMLKALWGYMGDKLNIPVANLTKESVREELLKRGIGKDEAERYVGVITDCEYAQYAPSGSGKMHESYLSAATIISQIEAVINK